MEKLKQLKQISTNISWMMYNPFILYRRAKEEAIKWLKRFYHPDILKRAVIMHISALPHSPDSSAEAFATDMGLIMWIKFFDIKEEDLEE